MKKPISFALRMSAIATALASATALAAAEPEALDLGLEELLKADVMTASRKSQQLRDVAAAVFVISREDIERSGATSIPEALRMAPGVQVARLANDRWAVTARGFAGRFSNKLLVLMDGRSIYSPLFSGVIWESEDTLLEDVDRIEVIRGPGAAMWGANAVNGVINIITRKSRDTQGNLAVAGAGTEEKAFGAVRHGGAAGDGHYRVWAKGFSRDASVTVTGNRGNDRWVSGRVGFRGDWPLAEGRRLMVSGSAHSGPAWDRWNMPDIASPAGFTPENFKQGNEGAHILGRHEWANADGSEASLQAYVDYSRVEGEGVIDQRRTTFDLDFQHRLLLGERHDLIWGLGYRYSADRIESGRVINLQPAKQSFNLFSAFLHDEITLVPDTLLLSLGGRLEHNSYTGFEPQPNLRLMWTPNTRQSIWAALSRAVRTPSRAERDVQLDLGVIPSTSPAQPPILNRLMRKDPKMDSEKLTALEVGYRHQIGSNLSLDIAAFANRYDGLRALVMGQPELLLSPLPHVVQALHVANDLDARAHGAEIALDWHVTPWWRIQPSYTFLHTHSIPKRDDPMAEETARIMDASAPRHQASLRSSMSLPKRQQFDAWLRYVGSLGSTIPAYTTLDLRYAWRVSDMLEFSLVGQNLLDGRHPEFIPDFLPSETMEVERGMYFKVKWQF